jgi:hypothetical protein
MDSKNVHDAFPNGLAPERFFDWHRLQKGGRAAALVLDGCFNLIDSSFSHQRRPLFSATATPAVETTCNLGFKKADVIASTKNLAIKLRLIEASKVAMGEFPSNRREI